MSETNQSPCLTENAVVDLIRSRGVVGREKYKNSMDRRDLSPAQWMQHHQEELCDALQYAERNKKVGILLEKAHRILYRLMGQSVKAVEWIAEYGQQFTPPKYQPDDDAATSEVCSVKSAGFAMIRRQEHPEYFAGYVTDEGQGQRWSSSPLSALPIPVERIVPELDKVAATMPNVWAVLYPQSNTTSNKKSEPS